MTKGSIRIETVLETKAAKKNVEELFKELKSLEKQQDELKGKSSQYTAEEYKKQAENLRKAWVEDSKAAKTDKERQRIAQEYLQLIRETKAEFTDYHNQVRANAQAISETKADYKAAADRYHELANAGRITATNTEIVTKDASKMSKFFGSAKLAALKLGSSLGKGTLNAVKKIGTSIKTRLLGGLNSANKSIDGMRKKFLKLGLAFVGMRGIWQGLRQLVSSALANDEKLQKQLTATKGVLGTALKPVIEMLVAGLGQIVTFIDRIYSMMTGVSLIAKYNATQTAKMADETKKAAKAAKEYSKQLASFDVANKLTDNSSTDSTTGTDSDAALFKEINLKGWLQNLVDQIKKNNWGGVSKALAEKVTTTLSNIDWTKYKKKAKKIGKGIAKFINGAVSYKDDKGNTLAKSIGKTISNAINTAIDFAYSFVTTLNWKKIGKAIREAISTALKNINWKKAIKLAVKAGEGIGEFITQLFTPDKDGKTVLSYITITAAQLANTIVRFFKGIADKLSQKNKQGKTGWQLVGEAIATALLDFFETFDWETAAQTISAFVTGLFNAIASFFQKLTKDDKAYNSIKNAITNFLNGLELGEIALSAVKLVLSVADFSLNIVANTAKDVGTPAMQSFWEALGFEWDGESYVTTGGAMPITVPKLKFKEQSSSDAESSKKSFWERIKEWVQKLGSMTPITMNVGGDSSDSKDGPNIPLKYKMKQKLEEIKEWLKTNVVDKIKTAWSKIKDKFIEFGTKLGFPTFKEIKEKWKALKQKIKDKLTGVTMSFSISFRDLVTDAINSLIKRVNAVIRFLKGISFTVLKHTFTPFSGMKEIDLIEKPSSGKKPNKGAPAGGELFAVGGIVNNPGRGVNAIVGEAGPEAILPLNDNTLGKLASLIAEYGTGGGQIVIPIYLDGKQIAKHTINTINQKSFQRNKAVIY